MELSRHYDLNDKKIVYGDIRMEVFREDSSGDIARDDVFLKPIHQRHRFDLS